MNNLRTNTSGIDCEIGLLQKEFYTELDTLYDFDIFGYPRVYKNPREGGLVPEWWNETTQDYEEVYLDTSKPLSFFFIDGDNHATNDGGSYLNAPLDIVVLCDLSRINTPDRADSEIERIFFNLVKECAYSNFKIERLKKGVSNVFNGLVTSRLEESDMHPFHVFSISGKISYYLTKKC